MSNRNDTTGVDNTNPKEEAKKFVESMGAQTFDEVRENAITACDFVITALDELIMVQPDSEGYTLLFINFYKEVRKEIEQIEP